MRHWRVLLLLVQLMTGILLTATGAGPTTGDLLLNSSARTKFVDTWSSAFVRVEFYPPLRRHEDPAMRPRLTTLGAIVTHAKGKPYVIAAAHQLKGVKRVTLRFSDNVRVEASVLPVKVAPNTVPAVVLKPDRKRVLTRRQALQWLGGKNIQKGLKVWAIEWPAFLPPSGTRLRPNLVQVDIGRKVEWPLDRFWYVRMAQADGMALLRHDGRLVCLVFRQVAGTKSLSLCSPGDVALQPHRRKKFL